MKSSTKFLLEVKNITKRFGALKAVDNCSVSLKEGLIYSIIGPNGSGKSTLFNIISGIIKADSGNIHFLGEDVTNKDPSYIANIGISRVFQQSSLFKNLTVEENLSLALNNDELSLLKLLFKKDLLTKEERHKILNVLRKFKLEKTLRKPAKELSFGQKRLVEIARSLLKDFRLLMLDEPVAGVNPILREEIAKILLEIKNSGKTVLLIEHDMDFVLNVADYVFVMHQGKIIARGKPSEIKNDKKVIEAYIG